MPRASGALCVLSLPARVLSHDFSMDGALNDPEKYAIRAAVQVGHRCSTRFHDQPTGAPQTCEPTGNSLMLGVIRS